MPDAANPGQFKTITVRPDVTEVGILIGRLLNVGISTRPELYGLYALKKSEVTAAVSGQVVSDEELDVWLGRLTAEER